MKKLNMFSIGEVSKITGMHIKSLRYYDRTGVFRPAYTDPDSGYRYYSFDQLQNIIAVRTCLDSGITLNRLAEDAAAGGFQINPLYYGMLMKCSGSERNVYLMAGIEDFLDIEEENEHIFRTPETWYSCVSCPDLDVRAAEKIWPEYFALDYDKVILTTTSLKSNASEPAFSLFINKPPLQ